MSLHVKCIMICCYCIDLFCYRMVGLLYTVPVVMVIQKWWNISSTVMLIFQLLIRGYNYISGDGHCTMSTLYTTQWTRFPDILATPVHWYQQVTAGTGNREKETFDSSRNTSSCRGKDIKY